MKDIKKIALITNSLGFGGIERVVSELSVILSRAGYQVYIFLMSSEAPVYDYEGEIKIIGMRWWQHLYRVKRLKRRLKIDYAISSFEYLNVVNILTKTGKTAAMLHSHMFQDEISGTFKDKFLEWLFVRFSRRLDAIVCVSKGVEEKASLRYPGAGIVTIYNSIDAEAVYEMSKEAVSPEFLNDLTFVHVGRFCEQKNQTRLLFAFALLLKKYPEARLLMIGDGYDREKLEQYAETLGIAKSIIFLGFRKNPFPYVKAARAFVLSSDYEGFGVVLIEALACGTPAISTDCHSGPREIIAPLTDGQLKEGIACTDFGILSALNEEDLCAAMAEVLENERYRDCEQTVRRRALEFSPAGAARAWSNLIEGSCSRQAVNNGTD